MQDCRNALLALERSPEMAANSKASGHFRELGGGLLC